MPSSVSRLHRPRTYDSSESIARNHLQPAFGKTKLTKLSMLDVQRMTNARREALAPRTLVHLKATLSCGARIFDPGRLPTGSGDQDAP